MKHQRGGGYSTNPENMIAGMPSYDKYDDCCQPLLSKGRITTSLSSKPLCGSGAQRGGAKNKNKKRRTSRKNNRKEKRRTKKKSRGKGKKQNKKNQKGGNIPGKYPESYNTPNSDYSNATNPDLDWKAKQPFWSPKGR